MEKNCGLVTGRKRTLGRSKMLALEMGKMLKLMGSRRTWEKQQTLVLLYQSFCPFASSEF